jgi:hypothetical protein
VSRSHNVARPFVTLCEPVQIGSTAPPNGDVNPYGVAIVPSTVGKLTAGDTLVSNFNDKANVQATGTTLVEISPTGTLSVFASITPSSLSSREACPGVSGCLRPSRSCRGTGLLWAALRQPGLPAHRQTSSQMGA